MSERITLRLSIADDEPVTLAQLARVDFEREHLAPEIEDATGRAFHVLGSPSVRLTVSDAELETLTAALVAERARRRHRRAMAEATFFHDERFPATAVARHGLASALYSVGLDKTHAVTLDARNAEALALTYLGRRWLVLVMPASGTDDDLTPAQASADTT